MSNILVFTYQHTCKRGSTAYILKNSPFRSPVTKTRNGKFSIPFLGAGHYLWEENIDAATRWGRVHYNNIYSIIEYVDLEIPDAQLLDFKNRRDTQFFEEVVVDYVNKCPERKNWALGQWLEFFKKLNRLGKLNFPFNYIRAEENLPNENENNARKKKILFSNDQAYYTYTSPLFIMCIIDKKNLKFRSETVISE
jgi:hypothetical protein